MNTTNWKCGDEISIKHFFFFVIGFAFYALFSLLVYNYVFLSFFRTFFTYITYTQCFMFIFLSSICNGSKMVWNTHARHIHIESKHCGYWIGCLCIFGKMYLFSIFSFVFYIFYFLFFLFTIFWMSFNSFIIGLHLKQILIFVECFFFFN